MMLLISFLLLFSISFAREVNLEDYVKVQAENIQLTADKSVLEKEKEMYKELYKQEKFWGEIKNITILVAVIVL